MSTPSSRHQETSYRDRTFTGPQLDRIAFPLGGIGAGMICMEGTGAFSHASIHHAPDVSREAAMFGALWVKGEPGTAGAGPSPGHSFHQWEKKKCRARGWGGGHEG